MGREGDHDRKGGRDVIPDVVVIPAPVQPTPAPVIELPQPVCDGEKPDCDPCPTGSNKERARCWMEHAFPQEQWKAAWHVVSHESAHTYDPQVKNYEGSDAWGLWQNRERFWDERVRLFFRITRWIYLTVGILR